MPSYICYECYEILINYSAHRTKFIDNQQRLEQLLLNAENDMIEDDGNVIEYEEVELKQDDDQIIIEEGDCHYEQIEESVQEYQEIESEPEEEELRLEDIVKPEFLHYCLPKKEPEPVQKVFHVPRQLVKERPKIEEILKEKIKQETDTQCQECDKSFTNSASLQQHINQMHRKFICEYEECSKVCTSQVQLNKHKAMQHAKKSTFDCQFCEKKFYQKLHLRNHLYTHTQ